MDNNEMSPRPDSAEDNVVRMRGLPWSATNKDITDFLQGCELAEGENSIHFTSTKEGRPSGECFVRLANRDELNKALVHNNEHMGKRYIEVFESKSSEMDWVCKRMGKPDDHEAIVRLRGLPFGCSKSDIATFFEGLEIAPYGITITLDQDGRCTGDAYVEFVTPELAEEALKKHKEKIGHRYIEIFKSTKTDIKYVVGPKPKPLMSLRPSPYDRPAGGMHHDQFQGRARGRGFDPIDDSFGDPYDDGNFGNGGGSFGAIGSRGRSRGGRGGGGGPGRGGGFGGRGKPDTRMVVTNSTTGHSIHMRGLPFDSTESDIYQFLSPLNPANVRVLTEPNGRAKGEADVDFVSHEDAVAAMQKDRQNIGHRYIELFLQSSPGGASSWKSNSPSSGGFPRGGSQMGGSGYGPGPARMGGNRNDGPMGYRDGGDRGGYSGGMPFGDYNNDNAAGGGGMGGAGGGYSGNAGPDSRFNQGGTAFKQEPDTFGSRQGSGGYNQGGQQSFNASSAYPNQPSQPAPAGAGSYGNPPVAPQQYDAGQQRGGYSGGYNDGGAQRGPSDMAPRSDYGASDYRPPHSGGSYGSGNAGGVHPDGYGSGGGGAGQGAGAYSGSGGGSFAQDSGYSAVGGGGGNSSFFGQPSYR